MRVIKTIIDNLRKLIVSFFMNLKFCKLLFFHKVIKIFFLLINYIYEFSLKTPQIYLPKNAIFTSGMNLSLKIR